MPGGTISWPPNKMTEQQTATGNSQSADRRVLILACGALAREILAIRDANGLDHIDLKCLPAELHNRPERIPEAVRDAIRKHHDTYDRILIGYADCGTGGLLDKVLAEEGDNIQRLDGPHCYSFFTGNDLFASRTDEEFTAFYLTDFIARQFDTLIWKPLGLDRHPELHDAYFAHYEKVVYLSQTEDAALRRAAERAAAMLKLPLEHRHTGYGDLTSALLATGEPAKV